MKMDIHNPDHNNYIVKFEGRKLFHCVEADTVVGYAIVRGQEFVGKNWWIIDFTLEVISTDPNQLYTIRGDVKLIRSNL